MEGRVYPIASSGPKPLEDSQSLAGKKQAIAPPRSAIMSILPLLKFE
jgi:hypothetical protein